jgi:hypothetical protein
MSAHANSLKCHLEVVYNFLLKFAQKEGCMHVLGGKVNALTLHGLDMKANLNY